MGLIQILNTYPGRKICLQIFLGVSGGFLRSIVSILINNCIVSMNGPDGIQVIITSDLHRLPVQYSACNIK